MPALQCDAMAAYATQRGWSIVITVEEVGAGVNERLKCEEFMRAARRQQTDAIIVWRFDRWRRSLADLVATYRGGPLGHERQRDLQATQSGRVCAPMARSAIQARSHPLCRRPGRNMTILQESTSPKYPSASSARRRSKTRSPWPASRSWCALPWSAPAHGLVLWKVLYRKKRSDGVVE